MAVKVNRCAALSRSPPGGNQDNTIRTKIRTISAVNEQAEVDQAARTLLMARRTAEAIEADARQQSQVVLGEAKTRADRQLGLGDPPVGTRSLLLELAVAGQQLGERRAGLLEEGLDLVGVVALPALGELDRLEQLWREFHGGRC